MNPLVSVIIPVYNVKPYLREALDSVIGQTYKNIEIIIVDDGSTDGSEIICDEYTSDYRVTVIHQANGGLSNARNTGLDWAKGDYLCFLDSDDAFHPSFIEKLLNTALNTRSGVVACKYKVQKTTKTLGVHSKSFSDNWPHLASGIYSGADALRSMAEGKLNDSVWNKLYQGNLWNNIRFPDGHNYEDTDATYLVVRACRTISMIDEVLYFYRDRYGSISHNNSVENIRDWMLARSNLEAFIMLHHPGIFSDASVERYIQRNLYSYMVMFAKCPRDKTLCEELRRIIIEKGRAINQWDVRTRVMYLSVSFAPFLFRYAYKIYKFFRQFVGKVIGR